MLNKTLALVLSGLLLGACAQENASSVDQSRIYTSYSVDYSADTNLLNFTATFNFGGATGTYLNLDGISNITLDGSSMSRDSGPLNTVDYQTQIAAPTNAQLSVDHHWVYTDTAGKTYSNSVSLPAAPAFTLSASTVSTSASLGISWSVATGTAAPNDIVATITRTDSSSTQVGTRSDSTGGNHGTITFVAADLAGIGAGPAQVKLCHKPYTATVNAPAVGGSLSRSYCAAYQSLTIQ